MSIMLSDVLPIQNPENYKVHVASWNREIHPLDVFVSDREEWLGWNEWKFNNRNDFNQQFIFSLIDFYPERDIWLFGGVFEVMEQLEINGSGRGYIVNLTDQFEPFIGRLKFKWERGRDRARGKLPEFLNTVTVSEILTEEYKGEAFSDYENINHDFNILESIFRSSKPDWHAALTSVKGVYMIVDKSNGKKYVGSAYGELGIWSRWSCYMDTGHGYNDELTNIIEEKGRPYAQRNFRFCLLEHRQLKTDDQTIIDRENWWKKALLSREFGYNNN